MEDVYCPYCGCGQEINHDDGYGYSEGVKHQQQCGQCSKSFVFETSVVFYYDVSKADCINEGDHDWQPTKTYPAEATRMCCKACHEERSPTADEWQTILPTPQNNSHE